MTAKEYLGQAYRIDQRINSKMEQIAVQMGYGIDNVYKMHHKAMREIVVPETLQ